MVEREEIWAERKAEHVRRHRDQVSEPWLAGPVWGYQDGVDSVLSEMDNHPLDERQRRKHVQEILRPVHQERISQRVAVPSRSGAELGTFLVGISCKEVYRGGAPSSAQPLKYDIIQSPLVSPRR